MKSLFVVISTSVAEAFGVVGENRGSNCDNFEGGNLSIAGAGSPTSKHHRGIGDC
jgi:hypothetical protein